MHADMHIISRVAWTAAVILVLAWPLLFWGKPTSQTPEHIARLQKPHIENLQAPLLLNPPGRHELLR
jgi:hypothetical protein